MLPKRVIPCLDVADGRVVKGTNFVALRDMGDPVAAVRKYEAAGADELIFLDISATAEERAPMLEVAERTAADVFIPFTVGGGIRNERQAQALLDAGADRIAVNSAILKQPSLLNDLVRRFGGSCVVAAIDVKREADGNWQVYAAGGQAATGREALTWAREVVARGAGEILLTSIDRDGTETGYDLAITKRLTDALPVPVIASGGAGRLEHYTEAIREGGAAAVLAASQFHSGQTSITEVKARLQQDGVPVRPILPGQSDAVSFEGGRSPTIGIVDYGVGNRRSLQQALQQVGATVAIADDTSELAQADGLVLPGVGAFQTAMERLEERGLTAPLRQFAMAGKPLLGICLGEQLLFEGSEEDGWRAGLGVLAGRVQAMPTIRSNIGWRVVDLELAGSMAKGLKRGEYFYHLHQYAALNAPDVVGYTPLDGTRIPTAVRRGNIWGTQFHPEKSGAAGLRLLRNFVELCNAAKM